MFASIFAHLSHPLATSSFLSLPPREFLPLAHINFFFSPTISLKLVIMEAKTNYLSFPAIAEFINAYEEKPTAENHKIMVSGLLTYAFDSNEGWVLKWQDDEENNHSNCFIVKATAEAKILHTVVKVILDRSASIQQNWDQSVPRLIGAPLPNERCWAILIRGLKVRLYEYHRDQKDDYRLVPCDFKIHDKIKHAIHLRKNADAVNNIFTSIPGQVPQPLDDDHNGLAELDVIADNINGLKATSDATTETVPAPGMYLESSSEDPPTGASEDKTPTEAEPVTELEAPAQAKTPTQVDTTTAQTKNTTRANGTQAKIVSQVKPAAGIKSATQAGITPQAKAALLAKAAAGAKSTTQAKTVSQVKPAAGVKSATQAGSTPQAKAALLAKAAAGIKSTPKVKPASGIEVAGQTATN
ncbi:unnamed protein product [Penicillium glandicola]